jgi:GxxExxY protein
MIQIDTTHNLDRVAERGGCYPHQELTARIIKAFYEVYNRLGRGFLEKLYERAMVIELEAAGLRVQTQVPATVSYKGHTIGEFLLDLVVEGKVLLELKSVTALADGHAAQLINYLQATEYELGLLLNFGDRPGIRRMLCTRDYKQY